MSVVIVLGILAVVVSLWDKFGTPRYRPYRALVFIVFGLSGIAPATHYAVENGKKCVFSWQNCNVHDQTLGMEKSVSEASLGWLLFMGALYITGALFYAFRIPERFFPGKVDIWVRKALLNSIEFIANNGFVISVPQSPDFPLLCDCGCICPLPRYLQYGNLQVGRSILSLI